MIDDAEREAQRRLAEAESQAAERLSSLQAQADTLIAQAEEIRQRSEQLLTSLSRFKAGLRGRADAEPGPARTCPTSRRLPLSRMREPEPASSRAGTAASSAGARLLATQMAISGSSREEIAARLRNGFEIDDPEAILEAILGPEG